MEPLRDKATKTNGTVTRGTKPNGNLPVSTTTESDAKDFVISLAEETESTEPENAIEAIVEHATEFCDELKDQNSTEQEHQRGRFSLEESSGLDPEVERQVIEAAVEFDRTVTGEQACSHSNCSHLVSGGHGSLIHRPAIVLGTMSSEQAVHLDWAPTVPVVDTSSVASSNYGTVGSSLRSMASSDSSSSSSSDLARGRRRRRRAIRVQIRDASSGSGRSYSHRGRRTLRRRRTT